MTVTISDIPKYFNNFRYFLGYRIYIAFAMALLATILEGFGFVMLMPLFQVLIFESSSANVVTDSMYAWQSALLTRTNNGQISIALVATIAVVAFLLKGALLFFALAINAKLRGRLIKILKGSLCDAYSLMDYEYFTMQDGGALVATINEQSTRATLAFHFFTIFGTQLVASLAYLSMGFFVAWRFGLIIFIVVGVLFVPFKFLNSRVRSWSRMAVVENSVLSQKTIEMLNSYKYLVSVNKIAKVRDRIHRSIDSLARYETNTGIVAGFTSSIREPVAVILIMVLMATYIAILKGPIAPMMVSAILFYRTITMAIGLQSHWQKTMELIGSLEKVIEEIREKKSKKRKENGNRKYLLKNKIVLSNVTFSYGNSSNKVLDNICLDIPANRMTALVGASGAGKTTIIDLVTGLLSPSSGKVYVDDEEYENINIDHWRSGIGYVSQDMIVFNETIANNISLWQSDDEASEQVWERIKSAAKSAFLYDEIMQLPEGFDTYVGDRGIRLSGGQRQRLFIARELFRKPRLLILDEATSALDSTSEREVQLAIEGLRGKTTILIVAHRLSTIRTADQVCVLEGGTIVESGSYNDLKNVSSSRLAMHIKLQSL